MKTSEYISDYFTTVGIMDELGGLESLCACSDVVDGVETYLDTSFWSKFLGNKGIKL